MSESEAPLFDVSLKKKKKSKKPVESTSEVEGALADLSLKKSKSSKEESAESSPAPDGFGEFEFKKKKKKKPVADDFDQALKEAGVEEGTAEEQQLQTVQNVQSSEADETYEQLLTRFFEILQEKNPEMASARSGHKARIPEPQVERDGNKKTLFSNIKLIADAIHRPVDHVILFMFTELGTSGSVDGTQRLVIKGRFQAKQIEGVLRRYIKEYVSCKTCKSVNTRLTKENRLYFLDCNSCGSRRSVQSIKAGYQAVTKRSRMRAQQ